MGSVEGAVASDLPAALVASTSGASVDRIGQEILERGGSATDAVLAVALAQTALCAGSWNSYAGILAFLHYDARTGEVASLSAGFQTLRQERHPLSIPSRRRANGRSVLVPGFLAGAEQAHRRFGIHAWASLFEPAIRIAEEGFRVDAPFGELLRRRRDVLLRLPEGREIFARAGGGVPQPGDVLQQPALARTLRSVAQEGAAHCYRGAWARRFVEIVRREGGTLTLRDLRRYRAVWTPPIRTSLHDVTVCASGLPGVGGLYLIEALNLLRVSGLDGTSDLGSPAFLYWLVQISRARYLSFAPASESRASLESASALWTRMRHLGRWNFLEAMHLAAEAQHSDAVVAIDGAGNVAALCHSIGTIQWGASGIFVEGVSIPDAASFHQREIARVGPGQRIPDAMNPVIVLRNTRPDPARFNLADPDFAHSDHARPNLASPCLACACTGASLHEVTLQNLVRSLICSNGIACLPKFPDFLCPQWNGVYRLGSLEGRVGEALANGIFGLLILMLRPFPSLARRVLDLKVPLLEGAETCTSIHELRRLGQPVMLLAQDPLPSTWVGFEVRDGHATAAIRSTSRMPG